MNETKYAVKNNFKSITVADRTEAATRIMEKIINKCIKNSSVKA